MTAFPATTSAIDDSATRRVARLLEPRSVAVIGASASDGTGTRLLRNLVANRYDGAIYPVNPKYDEIDGLRCYARIADIPEPVDVAAVVVSADGVAEALRQCVAAGVGAAVIMAAGFGEDARGEGKARQAEIDAILADSDLVVCGPNSEGYFNLTEGIALSMSHSTNADFLRETARWLPDGEPNPAKALRGGVAIVAQSGGLGFSLLGRGAAAGVGFSHIVSVGNEIDIDVLDCARYLLTRPEVRVVGMYVEGLRRPERLSAVAEAAEASGKVLVIGKAGASEAGRAAALSHTGHLAGEAQVYEALFRRLGIVQVHDQEELLDVCAALATNAPILGDNIGLASWSGGSAVWTSDALERAGFRVPELDEDRQRELAELLPPFASLRNPIDITGASRVGVATVLRAFADAPYLDALVLITTLSSERITERDGDNLAKLVREAGKPILVYTYTDPLPQARRAYRDLGLPLYPSSSRLVRALAALRRVGRARAVERSAPVAHAGLRVPRWPTAGDHGVLTERQTTELLRQAGLPTTRQVLATTAEEAVAAAEGIGRPVALKVQAPSLPHKAEGGGVLLGVEGADAVHTGFRRLADGVGARLPDYQGVLVQEMVPPGLELLVGIDNTAGFGPLIVLGFGGTDVERTRDIVMECAPLTTADALRMIGSLRRGAVLDGSIAGAPRYDKDALVGMLVRLSRWAVCNADRVSELDINPVIVSERGVVVLDSLLVMTPVTSTVEQGVTGRS